MGDRSPGAKYSSKSVGHPRTSAYIRSQLIQAYLVMEKLIELPKELSSLLRIQKQSSS